MGGDAPTEIQQKLPIIPSVVFFHGGGLTSGSREVYPKSFKGMLLILESSLTYAPACEKFSLVTCNEGGCRYLCHVQRDCPVGYGSCLKMRNYQSANPP